MNQLVLLHNSQLEFQLIGMPKEGARLLAEACRPEFEALHEAGVEYEY